MRHTFLMTTLFLSLIMVSGCGQPRPTTRPEALSVTPIENAKALNTGQALFTQHCSGCHVLQDPATQSLYKHSSALTSAKALITLVRNPAPRPMPAFDPSTLPDADVTAIYTWLTDGMTTESANAAHD